MNGTLMTQAADTVRLKADTLDAYLEYIRRTEAEMESALQGAGPFLWSDASEDRSRQVSQGKVVAQLWSGKRPLNVPDGLIHDWIGATAIPNATIQQTFATIQNYDNHKNIYKTEVLESRLISHTGNDFEIYLRLLKKKIITVVLDTDHKVHYSAVNPTRWCCRSYTTRIAEVEDAGKSTEKVLPADTGYGFLWRLYSYWRFQEREGSVYVECRAISLTRDIPKGLAWIIEPIIRKLPRESLINILQATRQALSPDAGTRGASNC